MYDPLLNVLLGIVSKRFHAAKISVRGARPILGS